MAGIYRVIERKSSADLSERLAAQVDDLAWRLRRLALQVAMLRHPRPMLPAVALDPTAVEAACALARLYFAAYPHRRTYLRHEIEGEFTRDAMPVGRLGVVRVIQLFPGVRKRYWFTLLAKRAVDWAGPKQ